MSQTTRSPVIYALLGGGIALSLSAAAFALWVLLAPPAAHQAGASATMQIMEPLDGSFRLTDEQGRTVTDKDFGGQYRIMTFGFTHCPDICPTQLQVIENALNQLPSDQQRRVASLFVSVDPERDTPARLKEFLARFHPRQKGLTGTPQEIADVARAFRVHYHKPQPGEPGHGSGDMQHTSIIYLFAPDGRLLALFPPHVRAEEMAKGIVTAMREQG